MANNDLTVSIFGKCKTYSQVCQSVHNSTNTTLAEKYLFMGKSSIVSY